MIENKKEYSTKVGTNLRLDRELKRELIKRAEELNVTLADLVNNALRQYFMIEGE